MAGWKERLAEQLEAVHSDGEGEAFRAQVGDGEGELVPLNGYVLIRRDEVKATGILLPDKAAAKVKPNRGVVLAADGDDPPVGTVVYFNEFGTCKLVHDGVECVVCERREIIAKVGRRVDLHGGGGVEESGCGGERSVAAGRGVAGGALSGGGAGVHGAPDRADARRDLADCVSVSASRAEA